MKCCYSIVILCLVIHAQGQSLNDSLLLHYPFDSSVVDVGGNGYDGVGFNGSFTVDRLGNPSSAALFDGIDDYFSLPNLAALKPQLPVSFSMWIKWTSTNSDKQSVLNTSFENDRSAGVTINTQASTGKIAVGYGDGTYTYSAATRRSFASNATIDVGQWQHLVVVVRGPTDSDIYIDCKNLGGTYSGTGGPLAYSSMAGRIGNHDKNPGPTTLFFEGALDDLRYWNRALTMADVLIVCSDSTATGTAEFIDQEFAIFPNPAVDRITLDLSEDEKGGFQWEIMDLSGKRILSGTNPAEQPIITISTLVPGTYFLRAKVGVTVYVNRFMVVD